MTETIKEKAKDSTPLEATVKFVLGDKHIYIDGNNGNEVTLEDKEADCVMIASEEDFAKMLSGDLNSMMAVMTGKLKIKGDMGVAMKLQSIVG